MVRCRLAIVLAITQLLFLGGIPLAFAESYSLSANPGFAPEANSGISLPLTVGGTSLSTTYTFTWRVTDPGGTTRTATNTTNSGPRSSIVLSVVYPRDFAGANTNIVGNYTVGVDQTAPSNMNNVASGRFEIGITTAKSYQRTFPVIVKGAGYNNGENVTVTVSNSWLPLPGFPSYSIADSLGTVTYSWNNPASTPLGNNYVALTGSNTFKIPSDNRSITITKANVTVSGLTLAPGILQRTQSVDIRFSATYNSGAAVASGTAVVRVVEVDNVTSHFVVAIYETSTMTFHTTYRVGLNGQQGAWNVYVDKNSLDDGYSDVGPGSSSNQGFAVQQAILTVELTPSSGTLHKGDLIPLFVTVTSPDGSRFDTGTVSVRISRDGDVIASSIQLSYVPAQGYWVGQYVVGQSDPLGLWVLQVDAVDAYGNHGSGTGSANVQAVGEAPSGNTGGLTLDLYMFLGLTAAVGSGVAGTFLWNFWKRRNSSTIKTRPFDSLFTLTGGEIPAKSTVLVVSDRDEEASLLGLQLVNRHLSNEKNSSVLAYGFSRDDVEAGMKRTGLNPSKHVERGDLTIVDCNAGASEGEYVKNPLDFSEVGVHLGTVLEKSVGRGPVMVLLASLSTVFKGNSARRVLGFLGLLTEKVKNEGGIVVLTVAKSSVTPETVKDLEGLADGIIELGSGPDGRRTLIVRKLFGRQFSPPPAVFDLKPGKGIRFTD